MKKLFSVAICALFTLGLASQPRINELMAANGSVLSDENGQFSDWVELYNPGSSSVDIGGYFLTDDLENPAKWTIPTGTILEPSNFLLIWADGGAEGLHCSFSLNRQQEELGLFNRDTLLIDSVSFADQILDYSYGRSAAEPAIWGFFAVASPGQANGNDFVEGRCKAPLLQLAPGLYSGSQKVPLLNMEDGASLHFTTDGSIPTEASSQPGDRINVFSTATLRVRAFKAGMLPSRVVSATYFINEEERNIPIVSLATDPANLWDDETGIHVVGTNGVEAYGIVANYNQDWERPISVELFEPGGKRGFQVDAGVKISGQYSRKKEHKTLAIYMRSDYGYAKLNYQLFPDKKADEYNNFLLRNAGSEWEETMYGEAVSQYIAKDAMDLDYMAYRPAAIYLNGEYWGILNLREKINEHYPESNYGIPSEEVILLESSGDLTYRVLHGSNADYMALRSWFETADMSQASSYNYVAERVELEHYTDYQITEIFVNNTDWPGNNIKYWKQEGKPDSKWRWIMYDIDRGFSIRGQAPDYEKNGQDNLVRALSSGKYNFILEGMMNNPAYRDYFIRRFNAHINTTFYPQRVHSYFDKWRDMLEPEMERHLERWYDQRWDWGPFDEKSMEGWKDMVDYKKWWASERPAVMMGILKEYFALGDTFRLDLSVNDPSMGRIAVNGVVTNLPAFSGPWFEDYQVTLKALPEPGYRFSHWEGATVGKSSPEYSLSLHENRSLQAVFKSYDLLINELMADNQQSLPDEKGEFDDWIEIHNRGSEAIDIGGMYLSDSLPELRLWQIPDTQPDSTTIPAGGFLLLWADAQPEQGVLHLGFRLSRDGERLALTGWDGSSIYGQVNFGRQFGDCSWGSYPDGDLNQEYMPATPMASNEQYDQDWPLVINEFMSSNSGVVLDEFEESDDWFELHNTGLEDLDVGGLFVTDDLSDRVKYRIPAGEPASTTIEAGGYLLLWADNDDEQGPLHTNFKLSASGEEIGLAEPGGKFFIDSLSFGLLESNLSFGRVVDGGDQWIVLATATPGQSNASSGMHLPEDLDLTFWPNPVRDLLNLDPGIVEGQPAMLRIFDMQGRPLKITHLEHFSRMQMNLSGLNAGAYILEVQVLGKSRSFKLMKL